MVWGAKVTKFPPSASDFPCQYPSTNAPYSLIFIIHQCHCTLNTQNKVCIKKRNKIMWNFSQDSPTRGQCLIQSLQNAEQHTAHVALCNATLDTLTWIHLSVSGNTVCINQRLETICELVGSVVRWRILKWLHSVQNWRYRAAAAFLHITIHLCYTSYPTNQANLSKKLRVA
jgi:hypothetical protein